MILKKFVVFEGIDGSGTTTQLRHIVEWFNTKGAKVISSMEPTESPIGNLIDLFLTNKVSFAPQTLARLFAADRCEHLYGINGIQNKIKEGNIVISDRYLFSSLAYQGFGDIEQLVIKENEDFPLPECLFFFDVSVDLAMRRIEKRAVEREKYEKSSFLLKVKDNYSKILKYYKNTIPEMKIVIVDASLSEKEIFSFIKHKIEDMNLISQ